MTAWWSDSSTPLARGAEVPDVGELLGRLIGVVGELLGASSLRLGLGPTLALLGVLLVLLSLVARPAARWTSRDLGRLASVPRTMALAAESGAAAAFSLGTAGVARSVTALDRLQTLAALPVLAHVARSAARSGVPIEVTSNDPVAAMLAASALEEAHRRTGTPERAGRSHVVYVGEGRATAAARAMAGADEHAAAFVLGSMREESLVLLGGASASAVSTTFGTADASQAASVMLEGEGTLVGPALYQAPSEIVSTTNDRVAVFAGNRLTWIAIAVLVLGSALVVAGGIDLASFLVGH